MTDLKHLLEPGEFEHSIGADSQILKHTCRLFDYQGVVKDRVTLFLSHYHKGMEIPKWIMNYEDDHARRLLVLSLCAVSSSILV